MRAKRAGRTLVIYPGALGDLLCLFPALRVLIRRAGGNPVELMARYELAQFAVGRMGFTRAHSIDRPQVAELFVDGAPHQRAAAFFRDFARVHCWFAADNPQFRRNLARLTEASFHQFRPATDGHIANAYLHQLGVETAQLPGVRLELLAEDRARAAGILAAQRLSAGEYVMLLPGSGSPHKNWPAASFIELAGRLPPQMPPLVVLGPAEANLEDPFRRRNLSTVSGLDLGTVAGLAAAARAFLGNDSGVSHLAAASGAPGLVLFGPTASARWRPLGPVEALQSTPLDALTVDEVCGPLLRLIIQDPRQLVCGARNDA